MPPSVQQTNFVDVVSTITMGAHTWDLYMIRGHVLMNPSGGWVVLLNAFVNGYPVKLYEGDEHRFTMQGVEDIDLTASVLASGCFTARVDDVNE